MMKFFGTKSMDIQEEQITRWFRRRYDDWNANCCARVMKPIPTLYKPLQSVDIDTKEPFTASIERSDSCAVPAASVVAEAVVAGISDSFNRTIRIRSYGPYS